MTRRRPGAIWDEEADSWVPMIPASRAPADDAGDVAALRERDALAQAIHDGRGILGFDNDGDTKPHTSDYIEYADFWRRDAADFRKDYDDLDQQLDDMSRLCSEARAEVDSLRAEVERLRNDRDEWMRTAADMWNDHTGALAQRDIARGQHAVAHNEIERLKALSTTRGATMNPPTLTDVVLDADAVPVTHGQVEPMNTAAVEAVATEVSTLVMCGKDVSPVLARFAEDVRAEARAEVDSLRVTLAAVGEVLDVDWLTTTLTKYNPGFITPGTARAMAKFIVKTARESLPPAADPVSLADVRDVRVDHPAEQCANPECRKCWGPNLLRSRSDGARPPHAKDADR